MIYQRIQFIFMKLTNTLLPTPPLCVFGGCTPPHGFGAQVNGITLWKLSLLQTRGIKQRGNTRGFYPWHKLQVFTPTLRILCMSSEMVLFLQEKKWSQSKQKTVAVGLYMTGDQQIDSSAQGCHHNRISRHPWAQYPVAHGKRGWASDPSRESQLGERRVATM